MTISVFGFCGAVFGLCTYETVLMVPGVVTGMIPEKVAVGIVGWILTQRRGDAEI